MATDADWRDNIVTRIATLEAVTSQRFEGYDKRFDKLDRDNEGMDKKLDTLIQRNDFADGSSSARGKLAKGILAALTILLSGSGITYLINWLFGKHP
jgi:hypothetical protein